MKTVKNIKEHILFLDACSNELNKLQNFIVTSRTTDLKGDYKKIEYIEDAAKLSSRLDVIVFNSISIIEKEIKRLNAIIDNTPVQIEE